MSLYWLILLIALIASVSYLLARSRALKSAFGQRRQLHSLPHYYGLNGAFKSLNPALSVLLLWLIVQPVYLNTVTANLISDATKAQSGARSLVLAEITRISDGLDVAIARGNIAPENFDLRGADLADITAILKDSGTIVTSKITPEILHAAIEYRAYAANSMAAMAVVVLLFACVGGIYGIRQADKDFRARNTVELIIRRLLIGASGVAILTTIGIILSLLFNTIEFFRLYSAFDFFFGTQWSPSFTGNGGASVLGVLPLLWGTFYISAVALAVAVPIGLFAAIYLSEYASSTVRAFAKPLLEVLAGIPTIVYGLFALLTVGPLFVSLFGEGGVLGVSWQGGGRAVITAGVVMGVMLIPFISSLSDDIINAVPQSLRDGAFGLGATKSETVKQVILPAALPGIVGAILLAASRAIGETMIVVLGAGAAAKLSLNPFEAMTTVTAKIVSQLTGDSDFASPEALVAFALGMTLFILTLMLNIFALHIVRKYQEQYD